MAMEKRSFKMSSFCNDMLEYLQNHECCMNEIVEASTDKDMLETHTS